MTHRSTLFAVLTVITVLALASISCYAHDTLFIRLTPTPSPTITPTPLAIETKYAVGDTLYVVSVNDFQPAYVAALPGPPAAGDTGGACYSASSVTVLDVARSARNPNDETIYYRVYCAAEGWIAEYRLTPFRRYDIVVVNEDAPMYRRSDASGEPIGTCPAGSEITIDAIAANPTADPERRPDDDRNIYLQTTCGDVRGFLIADAASLKP
jgi:hypothetical protein